MARQVELPRWLRGLMEETFFASCEIDGDSYKNKFCVRCAKSICNYCLPSHRNHRIVQVRRLNNCAAVKLDDLKELIDCSLIRPYNLRKVILLFLRPQPQYMIPTRNSKSCYKCGKALQDDFDYCSLTCMVEHELWARNDLSRLLFEFDPSQFGLIVSENLQTNVYDQPHDEVFDGDDNQITPDLAPIDFVHGEGSSSRWSLSDIVESCKKK